MKFNLWKIANIVFISFLMLTIWYLFEMNEVSRRNANLLLEEKGVLDKKLTEAYEAKKSLEAEIAKIDAARKDLADKVGGYESRLAGISSEYEAKMQEIRSELEAVKAQAGQDLAKREAEIADLRKSLEEYDKKGSKKSKKNAKKAQEEAVKLEPITVTTPKGKKKDVSVVEVNRDYGFVIIDMGTEQGIKEGDLLYVFRNAKLLGRVVAERVEDRVSVAKMLYKEVIDNVRKGDKVSY